jgi:hypothetical protein
MARRRVPPFVSELIVFTLASAAMYRISLISPLDVAILEILKDRRKEIYAAILGLHGSLLGFIIATVTVTLSFASSPRFEMLRRGRWWPHLFNSYTRSMRWSAATTLFSFSALLIDREVSANRIAAIVCFAGAAFVAMAIMHMLWVTEKIVKVVISAKPRGPGV